MTAAERLRIGLDLMNYGWKFLERLPPEERARQWKLAQSEWNEPPDPMED
jgi:hypothetical protein